MRTHVRPSIRPRAVIPYEHMFPPGPNSLLAQRALSALRLTRSFLLLEDDYDVDWEVDRNEHYGSAHPHRAPLRGRVGQRRPGQPGPALAACLCATASAAAVSPSARPRREDGARAGVSCERGSHPPGGYHFAPDDGSGPATDRECSEAPRR